MARRTEPEPDRRPAEGSESDAAPAPDESAGADDPTKGGALPDPADDSPRGRFNRGEIDAAELARLNAADADSAT